MNKLIFTITVFLVCIQVCAQNGNYADVNGVKIYYEIHGQGYPLVLLHGFTMSHEMWLPWVDDLSKDYQVILADLRGHGHSTNPSNTFTHRQSAKDIYALMDVIGIDKFKGIGFSSGAMTLTHMAILDSTRIEAMILMGSTSYFPEPSRTIQKSVSYETLPENWMNAMKRWQPGGATQIRSLISQFNSFADSYDDMNFTPPYLSQIKAPTLLIHGDRDQHFPVEIPVNSYKCIPNSYLWIIPNFAHQGIYKGSIWADAFLGAVNEFFSGKWSK